MGGLVSAQSDNHEDSDVAAFRTRAPTVSPADRPAATGRETRQADGPMPTTTRGKKFRELHALERPAPRNAAPRRSADRTRTRTRPARPRARAGTSARRRPVGPRPAPNSRPDATRPHRDPRPSTTSRPRVLGRIPALVALVYGPEHRLAYVNDAYAAAFGARPAGDPPAKPCPELDELGLLPLMDQVLRSGKPRTVKSRKVPGGTATARTPFTCTPSRSPRATRPTPRRQRRAASWSSPPTSPTTPRPPSGCAPASAASARPPSPSSAPCSPRSWSSPTTCASPPPTSPAARTPRSAATGTTSSPSAPAARPWSSATSWAAGCAPPPSWASCAPPSAPTPASTCPPHEVLQLLDGLAAEIDASQIATCVYAVHDPNEGRLVYASAGHLPILVRDEDGTVHRADEPDRPAPRHRRLAAHLGLDPAAAPAPRAVLYTDGLVERRDEDIDDGVAALERALAGATGTPQVVCDRLIRSLGVTADHDDDVAVLVLQHPARTGHDAELFHNAALELLGGIEAAPRARAFASGVLASWRFPPELHDLGVLAASELVANSLQHGTPPMRLRLRRTDRRLIIEVTDGDDHLPRRRRAEPADEAGRGISIVATIASSWGSRRTPGGGKAVWCEFALPRG